MKALLERLDRPTVIGIILILALVILTFLLVFFKVPDSDVFKMLVGGLLTMAVTVTQFDFGSSSGSKDKDVARDKALNSAVVGLSNNQAPANGSVAANPAVKAVLALFAILFLLAIAMPAYAETATKKPPGLLTGGPLIEPNGPCNPLGDSRVSCQSQGSPAPGGAVASPSSCQFKTLIQINPDNVLTVLQSCGEKFLTDSQAALASANNIKDTTAQQCLNPGVAVIQAAIGMPAVAAVPANPTTGAAAVDAVPAQLPGPVLLFQKFREFVNLGGLANCKVWINSTITNANAQALQ